MTHNNYDLNYFPFIKTFMKFLMNCAMPTYIRKYYVHW